MTILTRLPLGAKTKTKKGRKKRRPKKLGPSFTGAPQGECISIDVQKPAAVDDGAQLEEDATPASADTKEEVEVYIDSAEELVKACNELSWSHDTSTPRKPQSNELVRGLSEKLARELAAACLKQACMHSGGIGQ
jgi:hypothetical protein